MAKKKEFVEHITSQEEDFSRWYTDVIKNADMVDYSDVKGCMVIKPYGYGIWELIQKELDARFKATGHKNAYFPMLIPESLLMKEAEHVEGFAPEVAWVTQGGGEPLQERLAIRPTSETIICSMYSKWVQSYRVLPLLLNQWCSVLRWEKTSRPFLRHREFLWQEGHTMHETAEEAKAETVRMLNVYAEMCEKYLAIPVVKGVKTDKEKFAGAEETYTIEAMMHDGKSLQSGTSHYFGDGFARAFDIQFTDRNNTLQYPHQTSWGMSTRIIGAIIMTHGDNNGLVLPPAVAPIQVMVVPIAQHKEGVAETASALCERLKKNFRADIDLSENSPGWKFAQYEMKGVPLRLEIGPKDIEAGQCVLVRRDNREKTFVKLEDLESEITRLLAEIHDSLYQKALANREANTYVAHDMDEMHKVADGTNGFYKTMWCGDLACELKMKDEIGVTSRCMPLEQENLGSTCVCCGRPAKHMIIWGKAY